MAFWAWRLPQEEKAVIVFEVQKVFYVCLSGKMWLTEKVQGTIRLRMCWYLVDGTTVEETNARAIAFTSPWRERWKVFNQFSAGCPRARRLYMPLWSLPKLLEFRKNCRDHISVKDTKQGYELWGGRVRNALSDRSESLEEFEEDLLMCDLCKMKDLLSKCCQEDPDKVCSRLLVPDVDPHEKFRACEWSLCSMELVQFFMEKMWEQNFNMAVNLLKEMEDIPVLGSFRERAFERLVWCALKSNKAYEVTSHGDNKQKQAPVQVWRVQNF